LEDNIQCEIFHTILEEAQEAYKKEIVHQLANNDLADMETNIDHIVQWVEQFNKSNMQT
jgi:adenylate kinase